MRHGAPLQNTGRERLGQIASPGSGPATLCAVVRTFFGVGTKSPRLRGGAGRDFMVAPSTS